MNKGQIRAHFKALLNRSDCPDGLADIFIDQATTRIQRVLRTPAQEAQQTYTISSQTGSITIPNNLLEIMQVYMDGVTLTKIPLHEMIQAQKPENSEYLDLCVGNNRSYFTHNQRLGQCI